MNRQMVEEIVCRALAEDLGEAGDVTSKAILDAKPAGRATIVARQAGTLAGLPLAAEVFRQAAPEVRLDWKVSDGDWVERGTVVAALAGPSLGILQAERTALNFLGRLGGIATATRGLVDAVRGTNAVILDTRKTTPGLRELEKYAVRMGGGQNHRMGLYDMVLIKDNHIAAAGNVTEAIRRIRESGAGSLPVEVEVENLDQLREALNEGVGRVLLDNMDLNLMREAVTLCAGKAKTEASGGITRENVRAVAETGVDFISAGWITHSAPSLDLALELEPA
jgi:nicotinate-nucleotide pyrophosphorylase (carboxylating)